MPNPTLVLVHGAYHSIQHFGPLRSNLESHGYKCVAVSLPSTQSPELPAATLEDDTAAVRNAAVTELDEGNNVVVVAHSYGGCPANNALKDLDTATRSATGSSTSVLAIAFICAMPQPASIILANLLDHEHGIHDRRGNFIWVKADPGATHYFYNDLPAAEAKRWSEMLRPMSWTALEGETSYAAYMDIPSSYLLCAQDTCLPLPAQQGTVRAAIAGGAKIRTKTVDAGHSPFLSKVEETSAFIRRTSGEQEA